MPGTITSYRDESGELELTTEFCVVGSGAGGGVCALKLAQAGFDVVVLEEGPEVPKEPGHGGPCHERKTLVERESKMYRQLYQEGAGRLTKDFAFLVLQGRCLGGGTTVNWSACLPPPESTLQFWDKKFGLKFSLPQLKPHILEVINYLNINEDKRYNQSAEKLKYGCKQLNYSYENLPNNTDGCRECGSCGTGCPYDRKNSGIVKWLPDAVEAGARIYTDTRVVELKIKDRRVETIKARCLDSRNREKGRLTVRPSVGVVLAAGAIGTPAILLRSNFPNKLVGKYTHIHPITFCFGFYGHDTLTYAAYGVPDNLMTRDFAENANHTGYLIETGSFFPVMTSVLSLDHGDTLRKMMQKYYPHGTILYAHHNSGFEVDSRWEYGTVTLEKGMPILEYKLHPKNVESMRDSLKKMTRIHLRAGAKSVYHVTNPAIEISSESQLPLLDNVEFGPLKTSGLTVHVMGGCRMGSNKHNSVVDPQFRLRKTDNVWVVDGSVFPTGLGANPQVTIYSLALIASKRICEKMQRPFKLNCQDHNPLIDKWVPVGPPA